MARIEVNWPTSIGPAPDKRAVERDKAIEQKRLEQEAADDAFAAQLKDKMAAAVAQKQAERAADMDAQLIEFRRERDIGRNTPGHRYYIDPLASTQIVMHPDGKETVVSRRAEMEKMLVDTEVLLIEERLYAGLPAEPAPRKTPAEMAQERYDASQKAQS